MRTAVDKVALPGVETQGAEIPLARLGSTGTNIVTTEIKRADVYADGTFVGQIRYLARRRVTATDYGWVPIGTKSIRLETKIDAIRRLFRMKGIER